MRFHFNSSTIASSALNFNMMHPLFLLVSDSSQSHIFVIIKGEYHNIITRNNLFNYVLHKSGFTLTSLLNSAKAAPEKSWSKNFLTAASCSEKRYTNNFLLIPSNKNFQTTRLKYIVQQQKWTTDQKQLFNRGKVIV